jgi:hypothetical protein
MRPNALKRLAALGIALGVMGCDGPAPDDAQMTSLFHEKRAAFDRLRSEICKLPHTQTVWTNSNDAEPALPPRDLARFRAMLTAIGARRIAASPASANEPCNGAIDAWSAGMLDSGDSKSWSFGHTPGKGPDDLRLSSLDAIDFKHTVNPFPPPSSHGHRDYWRHLDGDWWLEWNHWQ